MEAGDLAVTYTAEMPPFSFVFFSNKYLFLSTRQVKKPVFSCFSLCCHHCLTFDGAHACWIWDFLVFKCLEVTEDQWMKDDLSFGDAQPRALCPLLRRVRLKGLSLAIVWGTGGQMLGNSVGPGHGRSRAAVRVSWFMRLFEPCLWNQPVSTGFCDVFLECKEILYSELKWSDVLCSQEKSSFSTDLTRCCAMWWIDTMH